MSEPLPRHPLSRYAARFSIVAPMAAFLGSCLAQIGAGENYERVLGGWLYFAVSMVMSLLILGGLLLGVIGLLGANKNDDAQTRLLALFGITLNMSAVVFIAFTVWIWLSR